jgi:hypothetical protein
MFIAYTNTAAKNEIFANKRLIVLDKAQKKACG